MPDYQSTPEGDDSFSLGMDSFTLQGKLMPGQYALSMNTINRGGMIQTRPGSQPLRTFVYPTYPQGLTSFKPNTSGQPCLVHAADGFISYNVPPFGYATGRLLTNIHFSRYSKYISWASCVQSTYVDEFGEIQFLDVPKNVLVMQDGNTRAAFWDGTTDRHLDPTLNETPVGLWMVWSNNRLWVSRGSQVFASDIGNPLLFTETTYLNEGRSFYLPGECTGMAETPDRKGIICFTETTATLIQSSIQDRTLWLTTPDFQQIILPDVGCVAPRSIVQQYGMLWWFSGRGLINLDDALRSHITSELKARDMQMLQSKYTMDSDVSLVCGGSIENFLLHGVPCGGIPNNRIHVMDQSPSLDVPIAVWASYWTGWRPIEFARCIIDGNEQIFALSADYDGINRIWRLFTQEKTDGGLPITSFVATRQHFFGNRDYKKFRFAEIEMQNIVGPTAVAIGVAGLRGGYQKIGEKDISSVNGQVYHDEEYGLDANLIAGSKSQTRIIRSTDFPGASECNEACVENNLTGLVDKCFSLLVMWSGIAGISAYRIMAQFNPDISTQQGDCESDETDEERLVTPEGCGFMGLFSSLEPFDPFYSTITYSVTLVISGTPFPFVWTINSSSVISQKDSDRKALAAGAFKTNEIIDIF